MVRITSLATAGLGGDAFPPWSAAHPYVNLYSLDKPAIATVGGNFRLTAPDASCDIRHVILDLGATHFPVLEGQSIGILPPGTDANGRPHKVRLFSVASPRDGERPNTNNLALTVKRVAEPRPDGSVERGVASNYVCDLKLGDTVDVIGPFGAMHLEHIAQFHARFMKLRLAVANGATDDGRDLIMFVPFDVVKHKNRTIAGREIVDCFL